MSKGSYKWIRGGRILTATEDFVGDVLVRDGRILAVAKDLEALGLAGKQAGSQGEVEEINAQGLYVLPGAVDVHTHLDLPFMGTSSSDDFETGTLAAAAGGTTSIVDFAIQDHGQKMKDALAAWNEKAHGKAVIDYGFHLGVTDLNEKTEAEIPEMIEAGVTSFKVFMAYKGSLMVDDGQIFRLMKKVRTLGGLVTAHCENADLIVSLANSFLEEGKTSPLYHERSHPSIGEAEATNRLIALSRVAEVPVYVVHLTCEEALRKVQQAATLDRHPVFAETCPQYLLLDRSVYEKEGFEGAKWVMSPPIRTQPDQEALWAGLRDGFIQTIATDHCPFHFKGQKEMGKGNFTKIPNGAAGIEDRLKLIYTYGVQKQRISLNRWVQLLCSNPARIFGMYPQKGTLAPGSDADIVLFDPTREGKISQKHSHQRCDYSAYEGFQTQGEVIHVLCRGDWVVRDAKIVSERGRGRFIARSRFNTGKLLCPTCDFL